MTLEAVIIWLVIGAIAGWLAGIIMKGGGFGLIGDIIVGLVGSIIGGWVFGTLNISPGTGMVGSIIGALVGAIILLAIIKVVRRA